MATMLFGGVAARIAIEANVLRKCGGKEALEKLAEEELTQSCRVLEKARSAFFGRARGSGRWREGLGERAAAPNRPLLLERGVAAEALVEDGGSAAVIQFGGAARPARVALVVDDEGQGW